MLTSFSLFFFFNDPATTEIYTRKIVGSVRSEDLAAKLPGSVVVDGLEGAAAWVRQNAKKGDLVVCMSCGDLYKAADMMVEK